MSLLATTSFITIGLIRVDAADRSADATSSAAPMVSEDVIDVIGFTATTAAAGASTQLINRERLKTSWTWNELEKKREKETNQGENKCGVGVESRRGDITWSIILINPFLAIFLREKTGKRGKVSVVMTSVGHKLGRNHSEFVGKTAERDQTFGRNAPEAWQSERQKSTLSSLETGEEKNREGQTKRSRPKLHRFSRRHMTKLTDGNDDEDEETTSDTSYSNQLKSGGDEARDTGQDVWWTGDDNPDSGRRTEQGRPKWVMRDEDGDDVLIKDGLGKKENEKTRKRRVDRRTVGVLPYRW